ncbi:MAG: hypothetical protein ACKPB7_37630 [Sphaerospermopsis kisseleviana]
MIYQGFRFIQQTLSRCLICPLNYRPVRAKHSGEQLSISVPGYFPNASPLRLLTPDSYALTERLSQQPLINSLINN